MQKMEMWGSGAGWKVCDSLVAQSGVVPRIRGSL